MAAIILAVAIAVYCLPPQEICEAGKDGQKSCTLYGLPLFVLIKIAEFIENHEPFFTATASVAIAAFTFTLWRATDKLWTAGERQLGHSESTAKRQLRGYMGINNYELTPYDFGELGTGRFLISMKNFGQTPAIALTTRVSYAVTDWVNVNTRPEAWDYETAGFPIDVAPGAHMFRQIDFSEHAVAHSEELKSGASVIWIKFCAAYEDIFRRRHEQTTLFYSRHSTYCSKTMLPIDQSRETTVDIEDG
jgi:hypothetical protein